MSTPNFVNFSGNFSRRRRVVREPQKRLPYHRRRTRRLRLQPVLFDFVKAGKHHTGQREQGDDVGQDDEVVEHIRQLPHKVAAGDSAEEDEHQCDNGIDGAAQLAVSAAEQVVGIDLAEQVPAQNGGEGEEQQTDGHELRAQTGTEYGAEGGLRQIGLAQRCGNISEVAIGQRAVGGIQRADNDQRVEGQHHKGVDEHADHSHHALIVGAGHVGLRVGVGRGAHTGLIGEQAALGTLTDGGLDGVAEAAADDGLGLEGVLEDHGEGGGDVLDAADQNGKAAQQKDTGHDGDDLLRHSGKALHAAQKDDGADHHQHDAHDPGGDAKGGLHGGADGVGLHHAAHEAQRQNDGYGEKARQKLTEAALERGGDVVHRAALDVAVWLHDAGLLRQRGLGVDGGHAEEGDDPHPEDGAGAAGEDRTGGTYDVAGAYLRGDGSGQGLKRGHTAFLCAAAEVQLTEKLPHALPEAAYLHKAGADGVPQANAHQQEDENVAAEVLIDLGNNGKQGGFDHVFFSLHKK